MEHTGFHKVVDGRRYNPDCPVCQAGGTGCPIGHDKIHCPTCAYSKEGRCDFPYHWLVGAPAPLKAEPVDYVPLETLARIRNEAQDRLERIMKEVLGDKE